MELCRFDKPGLPEDTCAPRIASKLVDQSDSGLRVPADMGSYATFTVRVATTLPSTSMLNTTRPRPSWRSARLDR